MVAVFLQSCSQKSKTVNNYLLRQFAVADSFVIAGDNERARKVYTDIRHKIQSDNPLISNYYSSQAECSYGNVHQMQLYADSALAFFSSDYLADEYPDTYYKALLTKGDAGMAARQYDTALVYYDKAKKLITNLTIDNGTLAGKIAAICYNQKNYAQAARYLALSYKQLLPAKTKFTPKKFFFLEQAALNNAGSAYEKAGNADSALYYYKLDTALINNAEKNKIADTAAVNTARMVLYDNLGGLYLAKNDLSRANAYLTRCLAIPRDEIDGTRIPPYIKLADLSIKINDLDNANRALANCRLLLNKFAKNNVYYQVLWNKVYAQYLFKLNQPVDAYNYLNIYIRLKDSVDNTSASLYRFNIDRELNVMHQQQVLKDLKRGNVIKQLYIAGITIVTILFIVLMLLIYRNLLISRKNQNEIKERNLNLQETLNELEQANKNYIRIMRVMAHDLRNPISGMIGLASLIIMEDNFTDEERHMLRLIESTGNNSLQMIDELLKTGLADANEKLVKQSVDVRSLLFDSVELLQFKANEKNQRIIFDSDDKPVIIDVSPEKIWRVFNNLIVNAIKFSHEGDEIIVSVKTVRRSVLISIADKGIGIDPQNKELVFEMFTPAKKQGTSGEQPFGLGLSISKKIVEKHGGRIWFESGKVKGTVFYIELPLGK